MLSPHVQCSAQWTRGTTKLREMCHNNPTRTSNTFVCLLLQFGLSYSLSIFSSDCFKLCCQILDSLSTVYCMTFPKQYYETQNLCVLILKHDLCFMFMFDLFLSGFVTNVDINFPWNTACHISHALNIQSYSITSETKPS